ncbi:MAG: hypothetical protein HC763_23135 [Hydrococcus sp. CRU_1_1]|nr:hypothetical protein [Hydrococcus sp. CRU_1_1]
MLNNRSRKIGFVKPFASVTLATIAVIESHAAARAVTFNFSYAPGTSLEQMVGMEMAGGIWSSHLSDNVSVNIYTQTDDSLPTNAIGGALPGISAERSYDTFRSGMYRDRTSTDDRSAYANLQNDDDGYNVMINGRTQEENEQINLTRANAKALGMLDDSGLDGVILISNLKDKPVGWNYNYQDSSVANDKLDYLSTGMHEIAHVLGFVSGVDGPGLLNSNSGDDDDDDDDDGDEEGGNLYITPLDMFRYSSRSQTSGIIDLSIGGDAYLSFDRGKTRIADFATGKDLTLGGDGYQASHWKQQDNPLGVMDPLLRLGQRRNISLLDRRTMDALGWNLQESGIGLATLELQAKQRLAARLGVTVAWLEANPTEAATRLSQDRTEDVIAMIEESEVYEIGWGSGGSGQGWWRDETLWQQFLANRLASEERFLSPSASVPEPSIVGGVLFGMGGLRLISRLVHRGKK